MSDQKIQYFYSLLKNLKDMDSVNLRIMRLSCFSFENTRSSKKHFFLFTSFWICFLFTSVHSSAQFTKLLDFGSSDKGTHPYSSLISDGTFLYGTTYDGGVNNLGTVYKIKPDGTGFVKLLDFDGDTNGSYPYGALYYDGTFLYGTTASGGLNYDGTIFKIMPDGTGYTKLFDFTYTANGAYPYGSLISDGTFLYGTTSQGGFAYYGTVFKIKMDGSGFANLYEFDGTNSGAAPHGSLYFDGTFLYGTTSGGYSYSGTVFKIKPDGTSYAKLLDFSGAATGSNPYGSLISDGTFLYGTTLKGGLNNLGALFKIKPDGTGFAKFLDFNNSSPGASPKGDLVFDGTFLYGTTTDFGATGRGTIFKIKPDGTGLVKLLDNEVGTNGPYPEGTLLLSGSVLFGTKSGDGAGTAPFYPGTIFKINNDGTGYSKLFYFEVEGKYPTGSLVSDGTYLYGMTPDGGLFNYGTIFKIKPDGTGYTKLLSFDGALKGTSPNGSLIYDGTFLYGMTTQGGLNDFGTVFKVKPDGTSYSKLLDFDNTNNGSYPSGSLFSDGTFLYGMTRNGGTTTYGTIFKIKFDGTGYAKLLDMDYTNNGANPYGSLISDGTFLYGMAYAGNSNGWGTLFKLKPDGSSFFKILDFDYTTNGANPSGDVTYDGTYLYGMTSIGGSSGSGTIFKIKPDGTGYTTLWNFDGAGSGGNPSGSLILDGSFLYGMAYNGGVNSNGTLFRITPSGAYVKLYDFNDSSRPEGSLVSDGTFVYGMTYAGGSNGYGTVFKSTMAPFTSISNFTPSDGVEGTFVTISGVGFDPNPANNIVEFNGVAASVVSAKIDSLMVIVPPGAVSGPISVTANGTDISLNDFTVVPDAVMVNATVQNCNVQFLPPTYDYIQSHGYNDIIETFIPASPTDKVKISFSTFSVPDDYLAVYDGPTPASPLIAVLSGNSIPTDIVASGSGGELTFLYSWADGSASDWQATVSCQSNGASIIINTQPSDVSVCPGGIANFTTAASGTTNIQYQWQFSTNGILFSDISNNTSYSGATTQTLSVNTIGNFGEGRYRCKISGDLATTVFTNDEGLFFSSPTTPTITANGTLLTASAGDSYQWYQNGDKVQGATSQTFQFNVLEYGVYEVEVTANGCTSTSAPFEYLITGMEKINDDFKVYPNPVTSKELFILSSKHATVTIFDMLGRNLKEATLVEGPTPNTISVHELKNGQYILAIQSGKTTTHIKIKIE